MQASYNKHLLLYFCVPPLQLSCEPPLYRQSLVTWAIECSSCGLKGGSKFASVYGFVHTTSSPKYPQSNGEAERAVKTVKGLLNKAEDPYLTLLAYRATPLQNGFSPAELLIGRRLRSTVPMIPLLREPRVPDYSEVVKKDAINKRKQKSNFDTNHGAIDLTPLSPGDRVWVRNRGSESTVVTEAAPRSYEVQTPDGTYRRNRRHLVVLPHTSSTTPDF